MKLHVPFANIGEEIIFCSGIATGAVLTAQTPWETVFAYSITLAGGFWAFRIVWDIIVMRKDTG